MSWQKAKTRHTNSWRGRSDFSRTFTRTVFFSKVEGVVFSLMNQLPRCVSIFHRSSGFPSLKHARVEAGNWLTGLGGQQVLFTPGINQTNHQSSSERCWSRPVKHGVLLPSPISPGITSGSHHINFLGFMSSECRRERAVFLFVSWWGYARLHSGKKP